MNKESKFYQVLKEWSATFFNDHHLSPSTCEYNRQMVELGHEFPSDQDFALMVDSQYEHYVDAMFATRGFGSKVKIMDFEDWLAQQFSTEWEADINHFYLVQNV